MAKEKKEKGGKKGGMNVTYLIGLGGAVAVFLFGCVATIKMKAGGGIESVDFNMGNLWNFFDPASILITIGCTVFVVIASFPASMVKELPRHFKILMNSKQFDPMSYIDQLVELAQIARKNGLLSLEEKAHAQEDPFFKQAIMLIVDAYDPDKVRGILETDIENMSARHDGVAGMYDKAGSVAPAFGMVGTLVGLINMLKGMDLSGDSQSSLGSDMGTALITTLYGCILAHMVFGPMATILRQRDEEEVLCKMIIVEGVMSIQAGENPKFLRERLMTYMSQQERDGGGGKKGKKSKKGKNEADEE